MHCHEFQEQLEAYLADSLETAQRESFREHLRTCRDCRPWAVDKEPTLVFAAAIPRNPDPMRVAECTATVMAQVRQQRIARRMRPRRTPWLAAAAAVLVSIAGAAGWWISRGDPVQSPTTTVTASEVASPEQIPPRVQVEMSGEGIRVYQFAEDGDESTAVYYIVNPALES